MSFEKSTSKHATQIGVSGVLKSEMQCAIFRAVELRWKKLQWRDGALLLEMCQINLHTSTAINPLDISLRNVSNEPPYLHCYKLAKYHSIVTQIELSCVLNTQKMMRNMLGRGNEREKATMVRWCPSGRNVLNKPL